MNNWKQSQQWGAPNAPFGQPQQSQGWGQQQQLQGGMGGWQQAALPGQGFFNPHQSQQQFHQSSYPGGGGGHGGFMAAGPAGGHIGTATGFPMNQGMAQGQFGGGFSQQQQFQAMQQQQQQKQMAYIQEQQRQAKEEQKKRDLEIQKRKLMNINVANPTASSSLSFDDLVSSVKTASSSSSRSASPKVTRQAQDVTAPKTTAPLIASGLDDPVPTQPSHAASSDSAQLVQITPTVSPGDQTTSSAPVSKQPDSTFEKLMESSLSNLRDSSPGRSRKMDFKASSSKFGVKPSSLTSAQKSTFSQSTKARAWTADGGDFSGVFAQHVSQQEQTQQATDLVGGDDSFGEFQSVGVGPSGVATSLIEPLSQSQGTQLAGLLDLQPTPQQVFQGQPPHIGGGSVHVVTIQEQPRLRAATIHGGNTIPTSAYQHPIPSTSVAEKPQSPTGTQFSSLDPSKFPVVYIEVFKRCSKPGQSFLDTELLFPLLMSSQLPKNVLRDLWSVANREVPGKLNQTELFVLLGLIGLAQSGNASPTPEDLKKASQLPIPKLLALQETSPSVSAPVPSSSQSHTHAPPTDDYGDFQQGQQSFQPSSFPPPPSSQSLKSPAVGLINVSSSSAAGPQGKPPTGGDKYSVFDDFRSIGSSGEDKSVPLLDIMKPSKGSETTPQLPLTTSTTITPPTVAVPPPNDSGFADFASFQQAPSSSAAGVGPSAPAVPEVDNSANQGWAAFADFTSSQATSSHSFPPPPSTSTTLSAVSSSSSAAAKSKAESAFDSLLPPELLPSKASKSAESEPKPVEATLLGSLESKLSVTTTTPSTTGLDFGIFELDISPESSKKKVTKQLTGLEVLEEEFSARVSARVSSPPAPLSIEEPLVPESAPLDDFGEFEAYSSPGGVKENKTSLPPLAAGMSVGEPSPSLKKKSSTDPVQVWRSCLSKCSEVLDSCVSVFSEVKEQTVLEEIAQSEEGRNKLKGIVEVYRLAKRVYQPFREKTKGAEGESCVQSIQKQWKKLVNLLPNNVMTQLYVETTPACVEDEDVLSDSISKCSLCLSSKSVSIPPHLSLDGRKEEYTSPLLFNSGQSYHSTCANFWLNVVQEELPVLT